MNTLRVEYLSDVIKQMEAYGERVQFSLISGGQRPCYQVSNAANKKMAFDSNNHLLYPKDDEFTGSNATREFTLDQIKTIIAGSGVRSGSSVRTRANRNGSGSTRTNSIAATDLVDTEKYTYFKNNRQILPPSIGEYSTEITNLMKKGMSAEEAFNDVIKRYF